MAFKSKLAIILYQDDIITSNIIHTYSNKSSTKI